MTYSPNFSDRSRLDQTLRLGMATLCGYELGALAGLPWPTITHLVHSHRHLVPARVAVWALLGVLAWHLLVEQPRRIQAGR